MKIPSLARQSAYMCLLPIACPLRTAHRALESLSLHVDGYAYPARAYLLARLADRLNDCLEWLEELGR